MSEQSRERGPSLRMLIVNNQGTSPKKGPKRNPAQDAWQLIQVVDSLGATSTTVASSEELSLPVLESYHGAILSGSPRNLLKPGLFGDLKLNLQVRLQLEHQLFPRASCVVEQLLHGFSALACSIAAPRERDQERGGARCSCLGSRSCFETRSRSR